MSAQTEEIDDLDELEVAASFPEYDLNDVEYAQKVLALIAELRAARDVVEAVHEPHYDEDGETRCLACNWCLSCTPNPGTHAPDCALVAYEALRASWVTERGGDFAPTGSGSLQLKPNAYEESRALEDKLRHTQTQPETHPQSH